MPSSIDLWNARFPDMFDITQPTEPQGYEYRDGVPYEQSLPISKRHYDTGIEAGDYEYGEPPQMQRSPEQLGTKINPPLPPGVRYAPQTKDDYDLIPPGAAYLDIDGQIYEKAGEVI